VALTLLFAINGYSYVTPPKIFCLSARNLTFLWSSVRFTFSWHTSFFSFCLHPLPLTLPVDYHHDNLNPSSIPPRTIISRANAIFTRRGIRPKQHLSEPRPGAVSVMERRAHADRVERLPDDLPDDMGKFMFCCMACDDAQSCLFGSDLMIEVRVR
jgi:hypothetical protein